MIIELERGRQQTLDQIRDLAVRFGNRIELSEGVGVFDTILVIGDAREFAARIDFIRGLPGVTAAWQAASGYNNIARTVRSKDGKAVHRERRVVEVKGLDGKPRRFGGGKHIFICGPDSPQTLDQTLATARMAREVGEKFGVVDRVMLRGGAYKPRTRPTDWRGLGMKGIAMLDAAREDTGLPYVTEVMDHNLVEQIGEHADMLQIGTRNAQNFDLLEAVGRFGKPAILKRGFGNEVEEWFYSAEYIANQGNLDIVLCERGMKTLFTKGGYCRNQPDLNACTHARKLTILPIIFDPEPRLGRPPHRRREPDGRVRTPRRRHDHRDRAHRAVPPGPAVRRLAGGRHGRLRAPGRGRPRVRGPRPAAPARHQPPARRPVTCTGRRPPRVYLRQIQCTVKHSLSTPQLFPPMSKFMLPLFMQLVPCWQKPQMLLQLPPYCPTWL
jgi:3-deoxy-7-phosphoheptulonate synthase